MTLRYCLEKNIIYFIRFKEIFDLVKCYYFTRKLINTRKKVEQLCCQITHINRLFAQNKYNLIWILQRIRKFRLIT